MKERRLRIIALEILDYMLIDIRQKGRSRIFEPVERLTIFNVVLGGMAERRGCDTRIRLDTRGTLRRTDIVCELGTSHHKARMRFKS